MCMLLWCYFLIYYNFFTFIHVSIWNFVLLYILKYKLMKKYKFANTNFSKNIKFWEFRWHNCCKIRRIRNFQVHILSTKIKLVRYSAEFYLFNGVPFVGFRSGSIALLFPTCFSRWVVCLRIFCRWYFVTIFRQILSEIPSIQRCIFVVYV